jgi:monoamine oxidase
VSRTPLFGLIRRALDTAAFAERHDLDTGRVIELAEARAAVARAARAARRAAGDAGTTSATPRPLTRRGFVRTAVAAAGGLALGGCIPGVAGRREGPVVIVGAGIAGLTAGWRLRQAGVRVRIYEAQNRIGGRIYSLRDFFAEGQVCELGGELIDTNHTHIRDLADELGIAMDDLAIDGPDLDAMVWWFGGVRRSDADVIDAFRPIARRILDDIDALPDDITYDAPGGAEALDRTTIAEWLDRAGAGGWIRDLLTVGYTTEYGLEIDQQSALNLLLMVDPDPRPFRIFGESDERFHVNEGNDAIPHALARRLSNAIEPDCVLEAVRRRADGHHVCTFRRGDGTFEVDAEDVVLTLPFTLLRRVRLDVELPPVKRRAIDELAYGTNAKLMVGFESRIWRERHASTGSVLTDLPFQLTWETSRGQAGRSGILTNFTGGRQGLLVGTGTPGSQAAELVGHLERVFPGIAATRGAAREVRFHWPTHPWTRGSYASYAPGQWTAFRGAEGEAVGRLYFAGEHTSLVAQGFMEGGCESGERVAAEILVARGRIAAAPAPSRRAVLGAAVA